MGKKYGPLDLVKIGPAENFLAVRFQYVLIAGYSLQNFCCRHRLGWAFIILHDQRLFARPRQPFDLRLADQGLRTHKTSFVMQNLHRRAGAGVRGAFPLVMPLEPRLQVIGDTGIERTVGAPQDIDGPAAILGLRRLAGHAFEHLQITTLHFCEIYDVNGYYLLRTSVSQLKTSDI